MNTELKRFYTFIKQVSGKGTPRPPAQRLGPAWTPQALLLLNSRLTAVVAAALFPGTGRTTHHSETGAHSLQGDTGGLRATVPGLQVFPPALVSPTKLHCWRTTAAPNADDGGWDPTLLGPGCPSWLLLTPHTVHIVPADSGNHKKQTPLLNRGHKPSQTCPGSQRAGPQLCGPQAALVSDLLLSPFFPTPPISPSPPASCQPKPEWGR